MLILLLTGKKKKIIQNTYKGGEKKPVLPTTATLGAMSPALAVT